MSYTKPPWTVRNECELSPYTGGTYVWQYEILEALEGEHADNQRLIELAPRMYELLIFLRDTLDASDLGNWTDQGLDEDSGDTVFGFEFNDQKAEMLREKIVEVIG